MGNQTMTEWCHPIQARTLLHHRLARGFGQFTYPLWPQFPCLLSDNNTTPPYLMGLA